MKARQPARKKVTTGIPPWVLRFVPADWHQPLPAAERDTIERCMPLANVALEVECREQAAAMGRWRRAGREWLAENSPGADWYRLQQEARRQ